MPSKTKTTTIDIQCPYGRTDQKATYIEVLTHGTDKLRIHIVSDSYDFQKSAKISRWNGEKWHMVHALHFSEMKTSASYLRNCSEVEFKADRDQLLKVAKAVLA